MELYRPIFVLLFVIVVVLIGSLALITPERAQWFAFQWSRLAAVDRATCVTGTPCVYSDIVDFRIIVITYNRPKSLLKLLNTINEVELDGDKGALEIWIDRNKTGIVHKKTIEVAKSFQWKSGTTRVHIQNNHAGIYGQWIDTWRPKNDSESKELALILEDNISVSKYIYRWIKAVHRFYGSRSDFAGTTLTSDQMNSHDGSYTVLNTSNQKSVFMFKGIGTWGLSPKPSVWKGFQDWCHVHVKKPKFHPYYVPGILPTEWYKGFEQSGTADSMWEQWFVYYAHVEKLFTIHNNLREYNGDLLSCLCINRREVGLHVGSKGPEEICKLLNRWDDGFIKLTQNITKLD